MEITAYVYKCDIIIPPEEIETSDKVVDVIKLYSFDDYSHFIKTFPYEYPNHRVVMKG